MKRCTHYILGAVIAFLLGAGTTASALDLSSFQEFLQPRKPRVQHKRKLSVPVLAPQQTRVTKSYRKLRTDADASYGNYRVITMGNNSQRPKDGLYLPGETRIPSALRPLLTERKNPREGISLTGNSGALLVPSPGVLEPGKSAVAVHAIPFDLYNINDIKYQDSDYFDTSVKLVYGVMEGFELGLEKTFSSQDRFDIPEPTYLNAKYQVPGNITIGGSFCSDSQAGYHSIWVGTGVPVAWIAVGANFGASDYEFYYNGYKTLKRAKFGGYNYEYDKARGYADPVFFMVGGAIPMNANTHFIYDFNGDRFSLGLRFNYQKTVYFDASFISDGDYESLPGAISQKRKRNFIFGGSIVY